MPELDPGDAERLLGYAVAAIRSGLEQRPIPGVRVPESPALNELASTFVTLERGVQLLGCIGTLRAVRPLYEDVMANAYKSAFADPRLAPISPDDFTAMDVKVSVLSPMRSVAAASKETLVAELVPGLDGVLLTVDDVRATFLPAVWQRVPTPDEFVDQLLRKGGLTNGWTAGLQAFRYTTFDYAQHGPRDPIVALQQRPLILISSCSPLYDPRVARGLAPISVDGVAEGGNDGG
ncbi:MAG: AmmeMemoRadiSam system protein A [Acidimicrobiales bacterium]